jgi:hypothetical protein
MRGPHQCAASIWKKRRSKELNSSTGHVRMKRAARSSNTSTMSASCSALLLFLPIVEGQQPLYYVTVSLRPVQRDTCWTKTSASLHLALESLRATVHERCRFSRGPTTRSSSMPSGQRRARMRSVPTGPCAEDHATLTFRSAATPSGVADVRASRAVLAEDELKNMLLNPER